MQRKNHTGAAIATAAAMLFGTAFVTTAFAADEAKVHCEGVNSCKSQSACKTTTNACKGQNACKGKGFLEMTKKECKEAKAAAKKS